jgi:VIT1/CCC1 family predicted Fe2+/Mn2+ transporter
LNREEAELAADPIAELRELTAIYVDRGLARDLAEEVASQLMEHDALAAHARDELGISEMTTAKPVQAALSSAASFSVGAALPLAVAALSPLTVLIPAIATASLLFLAVLGFVAARAGGANAGVGAVRVTLWGGNGDGCNRRRWIAVRDNHLMRDVEHMTSSTTLLPSFFIGQ